MGPDTPSDRPSPRGDGPALPPPAGAVRSLARTLVAEFEMGLLKDPMFAALWEGRAAAVLRELIRDA